MDTRGRPDHDPIRLNRIMISSFCLSMISAQTLRVCREGKPVSTFPDHARARRRASRFCPRRKPRRRAHKKNPGRAAAGRLWQIFSCCSYWKLEVIVDAGAQRSEPVAVRYAGDGEVGVRQIDVEIFDLRAPAAPGEAGLAESEFGADARGPACIAMAFRQAECLAAQFTERQAGGAIDQNVAEGVAGPAAHGAEPRIRELPRRKCLVSSGSLDVAFDAEHK